MAAINHITGDSMVSKPSTDAYKDNWERIFGKVDSGETNVSEAPEKAPEESSNVYRTVEDLPKEERDEFLLWLTGKTVPVNDNGSVGFYEFDYNLWKLGKVAF